MKRLFKWSAGLVAAVAVIYWQLPRPELLEGVPFSTVVTDRDGRLLHVGLAKDERYRVFAPLEEISPRLIAAALYQEDRHFENHPGINPFAMIRAGWRWLERTPQGGASTVTMQVARLRYHLQTRTFGGKLRQMFLALALERHYSKHQLLEAYFNLVPYGGNVEGAAAASWLYRGESPLKMSWPEAATFSVIPQRPGRRNPWADYSDLEPAYSRQYQRLLAAGMATDPLGSEFSFEAIVRIAEAPHWVRQLGAEFPDARTIRSSLSLPLQRLLEKQVGAYLAEKGDYGLRNAAVLLVDTQTLQVRAKIGSANFLDESIQGQVDGTRSRRSPGSTLKPLIYALAMDQGLIHPASVLLDTPMKFADYDPENFDRAYCGPLPAAQALALSRNVPAVELAAKLRHPNLEEFLGQAGVGKSQPARELGLSIALGAEEVSPEEIARLYAMLANHGELRPLESQLASPAAIRRLVSPEAAFLTLQMLSTSSLEESFGRNVAGQIAWKTGTSFGFHDAWTVAVFDHYVLVVWLGNFDGQANPFLVGKSAAAPLVFRMIASMERVGQARLSALPKPANANLREVELCVVSGQIPGPDCRDRQRGWIIPGVSPIDPCAIHRSVWVEQSINGERGKGMRQVYEFWPSNVQGLFAQAGLPWNQPPSRMAGIDLEQSSRIGQPPRIVSPSTRQRWLIRSGSSATQSVPLQAQVDADVREIYWFANQRFLGKQIAGSLLEWPANAGKWQLLALDDHGRSATCELSIEVAER